MSLGRQTLSGGLWNLLANVGQQALNFVFFVYMARLLEPSAFGLVALALVLVDIAQPLGRVGLVEVMIRRKDLDDAFLNRVFWFLQAVGVALVLLVLAAAHPLGAAFGHAELAVVLVWLAPVCWLQNLCAVPEARLQREFGYKSLTKRTLVGVSVGGTVGLALALAGFGVEALVLQKIATVLVQSVILWLSDGWVPGRPVFRTTAEFRRSLRMGVDVMASSLMNMFNTKLLDVLIGAVWGAAVLGYFRTAWKIFEILIYCTVQPLVGVAFVAFTKLDGEAARLVGAYRRMTEVSSLLFVPALLGMSAVAPLLVPLLLGDKWQPSSDLLRVFGFMAFAAAVDPFFAPMMTAAGRTSALVKQGTAQAILSVASILVAAPFGVVAMAVGQVVRASLVEIVNLVVMKKELALPYAATWASLRPAAIAGLAMWAGVVALSTVLPASLGAWTRLAGLITAGAALYAAVLLLVFRGHVTGLLATVRGYDRR